MNAAVRSDLIQIGGAGPAGVAAAITLARAVRRVLEDEVQADVGRRLGGDFQGRKKVDDGAIVVVAKDDRALRIEVGYGLEGALTDLTAKRIISGMTLPRFKQRDFYGGIAAGVGQITRVIDGEALPAPSGRNTAVRGELQRYGPILFIVPLSRGGVLRSAMGNVSGAVVTGGAVGLVAWFVAGALSIAFVFVNAALLFTVVGGGRALHGLGGMSGGGGRGHGGGGGICGGGGGFGGGGAPGRW